MFEPHFGFQRTPFERDIPPRDMYEPQGFKELRSRLSYSADRRKFCVVTGDVGVGKTTAIRSFVSGLHKGQHHCVYIADSALTPRVFYWEVLSQLGIGGKPCFYRSEGKRKMLDELDRLSDESHIIPVIIVDEAHLLSRTMLEETRFLLNQRMDSANPMSLILVGQGELRAQLSKEMFEPITQRIDFHFRLAPYDRSQTAEYIQAHMRYAGDGRGVFSDGAVDAVYRYSGGVARKINKACQMALLYAAQSGKHAIDGQDVDYVVEQELVW